MERQRCSKCRVIKSVSEYYSDSTTKSGIKRQCKKCYLEGKKYRRKVELTRARLWSNDYMEKYNQTSKGKYHKIKINLKKRGLSLDINKDTFIAWFDKIPKQCYYCKANLTITTGSSKHTLTDLTIDRKDNNLGYTEGNLVVACRRCNIIKGSWFTEKQMLQIAKQYLKN